MSYKNLVGEVLKLCSGDFILETARSLPGGARDEDWLCKRCL